MFYLYRSLSHKIKKVYENEVNKLEIAEKKKVKKKKMQGVGFEPTYSYETGYLIRIVKSTEDIF